MNIKTRSLKLEKIMKTHKKIDERDNKSLNEPQVIVVDTIEELIEGLAMAPVEELSEVTGCDSSGKEYTFSTAEYIKSLKDMGCFGYSDKPNKKIYIWIGEDAKLGMLVNLLAHEMAHQTEVESNTDPDIQDELDAMRCGYIAEWAYNKVMSYHCEKLMKKNTKKGS